MAAVEIQLVAALNGGQLSAFLTYDSVTNVIASLRYQNAGPSVAVTGAAYDKGTGHQLFRGTVTVPTGSQSVPAAAIPGGPWKVTPIAGRSTPDLPWSFSFSE